MNRKNLLRRVCLLLCLALVLSALGGFPVFAEDLIWTPAPTGWTNWGHVTYQTENGYLLNWGVRGETCRFLSREALDYYPEKSWGLLLAQDYPGGTGTADAVTSPLYAQLRGFLRGRQTHETTYNETRELFRYTDCMVSDSGHISSFYSGRKLNGAWDKGATWNREHTWPNSKADDNQDNDIMMLRPTSNQENSGRGNLAYGLGAGYYDPNAEAGGRFNLHGDVARICLYCYVRWNNQGNMWGKNGVIQSLDTLLAWMEEDPVDTWEMGRNDAVQSITGVRNCFVDYPELAWALFGQEVPALYPTPRREGNTWPPASVPAYLEARSEDEAHGTVAVEGQAVDCSPAPGYYASGFDLYDVGGETSRNGFADLFRWENGRLLYFPVTEQDFLVEIHFSPLGTADPCPTGHAWDEGTVTVQPGVGTAGKARYTCTRCGRTSLRTLPAKALFDDVQDETAYFFTPVYWAVNREPQVTKGTSRTAFSPYKPCTRGEIVTFLWRAAGTPPVTRGASATHGPFLDVPGSAYYYDAVVWAVSKGITKGTSRLYFSPDQICSRGEIVTFLWRAMGKPAGTGPNPFTDVAENAFYRAAVLWAVEGRITKGTSKTTFSPYEPCTRGEAVTFLWRTYRGIKE